MTAIRAFVGHSFTAEDESVVKIFTDFLDELKLTLPSFSWEHAERAEPNTLTDKVLRIAKDKNLFIGICTSKEKVVPLTTFARAWPIRIFATPKPEQVAMKTSDWIIQEIGMAIGMGMKTILLCEKGLRNPGGLQGNTEYIEFSRTAPSEAFTKLLQMISAMTPKESMALITAKVENSSVEAADAPEQAAAPIDFATPANGWDRATYEFASLRAIGQKDEIVLRQIDEAYRQTPNAAMDGNMVSWEAHLEWARLRSGNEGSIDRLRAMATSNPTNAKVKHYLARAFAFFNEHTTSAETYISASDLAGTDVEYKSRLLRLAAEQYLKDTAFKDARAVADRIRTYVPQHDGSELIFLRTMSAIARDEADDRLQVAALERILELTPDDTNGRFILALKQSELGNDDLALRNYLKIPEDDRIAGTWNNIGVQYDKYKMSGKAVDAFSKSADLGETLAMSNLGNKLLGEGFVDQARAQCDRAIPISDRHQNIGDLMSRIAQIPEIEQKLLDEVLSGSKTKSDFYRLVGRAISGQNATSFCLSNRWRDSDCTMTAVKIDNGVRLEGFFERESILPVGLLSALAPPPYSGGVAPSLALPKRKHEIRYTGHFEGGAFFGKIERKTEGDTFLGSASVDNEVIMVLSPDQSRLSVMESPSSTSPKFYQLDRV